MFIYATLSVLIVSAMSLISVFILAIKESTLRKYVFLFVSLAVGALLGDAFLHLIPEALEVFGSTTLVGFGIIAGVLLFFIIEKILHWHHHEFDEHNHVAPIGKMILISDGFHNFIDGLIIGASYMVSIELGIATTLAVILHELPQEIGDFGVLIHAGYSTKRALLLNFLSAVTAFVGLGVAFILGTLSETFTTWLLPIAAGGFIYIAIADLIPELHKTKKTSHALLQAVIVIIGVLLMAGLLLLE